MLDDLFIFDPMTAVWTNMTAIASGNVPSARNAHRFALADGLLYMFGGFGYRSTVNETGAPPARL